MRRYWLDRSEFVRPTFLLGGDRFHHIFKVCRTEENELFEVIIGDGNAYVCRAKSLKNHSAEVEVVDSRVLPPQPLPHLRLCLSIPKLSTFEIILEKAVELGVCEIQLFTSEFSHVKKIDTSVIKKYPRFEKIITNSSQQTGRGDLMSLPPPKSLKTLLDELDGRSILFYEHGGESIKRSLGTPAEGSQRWLNIFVGSEGGFHSSEIDLFRSKGINPIHLGPQILRVETACVTILSVIKYWLGHFDNPAG
ncbi:MAG: hypothetical protein COT74_10170 [Bdellovibrionales bacterium CG10_big_fil_rev_8_21_14_0_10_45_34]|nr:MAG: hypothetical protein COT74_10170 [Bdellovibrionales bacterium CG10_big_fil_rev_8_21_14_0_10_45_34]